MASLEQSRDLIDLGAYVPGKNAQLDRALQSEGEIKGLLQQPMSINAPLTETSARMQAIAQRL